RKLKLFFEMKLVTLDAYSQPVPIVTGVALDPLGIAKQPAGKAADKKEEQHLSSMVHVLRRFLGNRATSGQWQKQMETFGGGGWSKSSFLRRMNILKARGWVTVVGQTERIEEGERAGQGELFAATDSASEAVEDAANTTGAAENREAAAPENQSQPNWCQAPLQRGLDTSDTSFEAEEDQKAVSKWCHDTGDTTSNKSGNSSDPVVPDGVDGAAKRAKELMERLDKKQPHAA